MENSLATPASFLYCSLVRQRLSSSCSLCMYKRRFARLRHHLLCGMKYRQIFLLYCETSLICTVVVPDSFVALGYGYLSISCIAILYQDLVMLRHSSICKALRVLRYPMGVALKVCVVKEFWQSTTCLASPGRMLVVIYGNCSSVVLSLFISFTYTICLFDKHMYLRVIYTSTLVARAHHLHLSTHDNMTNIVFYMESSKENVRRGVGSSCPHPPYISAPHHHQIELHEEFDGGRNDIRICHSFDTGYCILRCVERCKNAHYLNENNHFLPLKIVIRILLVFSALSSLLIDVKFVLLEVSGTEKYPLPPA